VRDGVVNPVPRSDGNERTTYALNDNVLVADAPATCLGDLLSEAGEANDISVTREDAPDEPPIEDMAARG
jgi:hypothetical protein